AIAVVGPLVAPYDPRTGSLIDQLQPASWAHPLGTDEQGRDVLSRMLYGARNSLAIGIGAVAMAVVVGCVVGALAGAAGGLIDAALMRITDGLLAIPGIVLAIGMVALLGQGFFAVMVAVALTNAPAFARLLRSSLVALGPAEYI
ncbi:ABC transporter permease subunit, partial [Mesorhizobium sp. M7D.F.Ca.US.004.03.1.1]